MPKKSLQPPGLEKIYCCPNFFPEPLDQTVRFLYPVTSCINLQLPLGIDGFRYALVAQLAEHIHGKDKVTSSILVEGLRKCFVFGGCAPCIW